MKYFVISDVHNQYEKMIKALDEAGLDKNNTNHCLVMNGDMVDIKPGKCLDPVKDIVNFIYDVKESKAQLVYITGNHEWSIFENIKRTPEYYSRDELFLAGVVNGLTGGQFYLKTKTHFIAHTGYYFNLYKDREYKLLKANEDYNIEWMYSYGDMLDDIVNGPTPALKTVIGHIWIPIIHKTVETKSCSFAWKDYNKYKKGTDFEIFEYRNRVFIDGCAYNKYGKVNVYTFEEDDWGK